VDRELVERAQHGDRAAYEALVRDSARRLYLVCQRILRDGDQAEDATQQALVEMWRDLRGLRDPDRFEAWTYRIAVRCAIAEARRERRLRGTVRLLPGDGADCPDGPDGPGAVSDREALQAAFAHLSPEHRAVVVLRFFVGLSLEEIAQVVGAPAGTVASRLHYALLGLRRELLVDDRPIGVEKGLPA
jgi:RNA polymerase sigma-70 factor (ECF subfamily)